MHQSSLFDLFWYILKVDETLLVLERIHFEVREAILDALFLKKSWEKSFHDERYSSPFWSIEKLSD